MTNKELYDILNKTVPLEAEKEKELNGDWRFSNQLSFADAKIDDTAININTIKKIFDNLNRLNKLVVWGVENYGIG